MLGPRCHVGSLSCRGVRTHVGSHRPLKCNNFIASPAYVPRGLPPNCKTQLQFLGDWENPDVFENSRCKVEFSAGISTFDLDLKFLLHHYPAGIDFPTAFLNYSWIQLHWKCFSTLIYKSTWRIWKASWTLKFRRQGRQICSKLDRQPWATIWLKSLVLIP